MYTFHTLVLSPIENQKREAYAHEHIAKHSRQNNPPPGTRSFRRKREKIWI